MRTNKQDNVSSGLRFTDPLSVAGALVDLLALVQDHFQSALEYQETPETPVMVLHTSISLEIKRN